MSGPEHPTMKATVVVQTGEPELVGAAFEMVHTIARASEMSDIDGIDVEMTVTFSGHPHPLTFERFKAQINRMWMARVKTVETEERAQVGEGKQP